MPTKRDMEVAVMNWRAQASELNRRLDAHIHGINLLINDAIDWFAQFRTFDDGVHEFGIGIAKNVPAPKDWLNIFTRKKDKEDFPVVLWKTTWATHKYMTMFEVLEFQRLPKQLEEEQRELSDVAARAVQLVDHAIETYKANRNWARQPARDDK
jgi:hypothetical protein